jgi:plastocyanin domain-containing protein
MSIRDSWKRSLLAVLLAVGGASVVASCTKPAGAQQATVREVELVVHGSFAPDRITAAPGERLRLKVTRHDEGDCTHEIVFPALGIRATLPAHQTTVIDLPPLPAGETSFECGMKMIHGTIVAKSKG